MSRYASQTRNLPALFNFLRPHVALQAAAYVFVGAYLSGAGWATFQVSTLTAAVAVALTVAFGFVINDYMDRELDRIQKPERPLPAGLVRLNDVRLLGAATVAATLMTASLLETPLMIWVWLNLLLTAAYSIWLKRTVFLGNLAIALLNSSIILFGASASGGLRPLVWSIAATTLLFSLAQEVLYTVDDYPGDRQAGIMTTAIFLGPTRALRLVQVLLVALVISSFVPLGLGSGSLFYLIMLLPCTLAPVALRLWPLTRQADPQAVSQAVALIKQVRASSLLPLLLLHPLVG
ncbi:MAG: UbiA family prenyltransferase [Oscillochloridaceae bacterium umkhey_bin13]